MRPMHSYFVPRGTALTATYNDGPPVAHVTTRDQIFWATAAQSADTFTFAEGAWRLCVPKSSVTASERYHQPVPLATPSLPQSRGTSV